MPSQKTAASPRQAVRNRLIQPESPFSKSEMKVVRVLLANYPAAGLTTISRLAKDSNVSDPTVLRVAQRLGYNGFSDMQDDLLAEVESQMRSPLSLSGDKAISKRTKSKEGVYQKFFRETLTQCEISVRETPTVDYEAVSKILANPRKVIHVLGGRFSRFLAGILQRSLNHLRDGTELLDSSGADLVDRLVAVDGRNVLVVFDYRRYQEDVIRFAEIAKKHGATIVLFTDTWRSPIADFAHHVISAPTATASPFDTLVVPLLHVEAVVAGVADDLGDEWKSRAARLEKVRSEHRDGSELATTRREKQR